MLIPLKLMSLLNELEKGNQIKTDLLCLPLKACFADVPFRVTAYRMPTELCVHQHYYMLS